MHESGAAAKRLLARLLPQSLLGRLALVMLAGVLATQLAGNLIWASQLRARNEAALQSAASSTGHAAASAIRFFRSLPPSYRRLLIEQFREMGGTRFFVNAGYAPVAVQPIAPDALADSALRTVAATLHADLPGLGTPRLAFAWPRELAVDAEGILVTELPESWVQHILLLEPEPAPVLVIQTELEPGHWLYLAALMPDPYFLASREPLSPQRLLLQGLPLAAVLLLSLFFALRWITRPLAALSDAAEALGRGEPAPDMPQLPESGSREFVATAHAFNTMRERIRKYIDDRERLFASISHDLRTPITRLKLRSELLDDDALRADFEEDLDELDMMVKGALQCVKDSDIHENLAAVKLDPLIERLVRGARLAGHAVAWQPSGLSVRAKPLALKRAIGNLLDNALHYGEHVEITCTDEPGWVAVAIRDHGPGVPDEALGLLFEPRVRLAEGRAKNEGGQGLGLGIARGIAVAHGGRLQLQNHPDGGLLATLRLPAEHPAAGAPASETPSQ